MQQIKKVVVIGPESTGKSTLCKQLANHFNTLWCEEYAREYLLEHGTNYTADDLLTIAKGQLALEDIYTNQTAALINKEPNTPPVLFVDTDMYVMKVWSEYVFGVCDFFILEELVKHDYDLYLLCNIDLPWVKDELREYPDEQPRIELFHIYKDLLINQHTPWAIISGNYEARLNAAVKAVEGILK
jgi:NadR type nicotinamide-nucleotide adenylyltransferase